MRTVQSRPCCANAHSYLSEKNVHELTLFHPVSQKHAEEAVCSVAAWVQYRQSPTSATYMAQHARLSKSERSDWMLQVRTWVSNVADSRCLRAGRPALLGTVSRLCPNLTGQLEAATPVLIGDGCWLHHFQDSCASRLSSSEPPSEGVLSPSAAPAPPPAAAATNGDPCEA